MFRYCKDYQGLKKGSKYLEEDAEQHKSCEKTDKFLEKSKSERLEILLVSDCSDDKENETSNTNKEEKAAVIKNEITKVSILKIELDRYHSFKLAGS